MSEDKKKDAPSIPDRPFRIAVTVPSLCDTGRMDDVFDRFGLDKFRAVWESGSGTILSPGPAIDLLTEGKKDGRLEALGWVLGQDLEINLVSRHSAFTAPRVLKSVASYGVELARAVLVSGDDVFPFLPDIAPDVVITTSKSTARRASKAGYRSAVVTPAPFKPLDEMFVRRLDRQVSEARSAIAATLPMTVVVSAPALFDLGEATRVFDEKGLDAYREWMLGREEPLRPGPAFPQVQNLLKINEAERLAGRPEPFAVCLVSRNDVETSIPVIRSMKHYGMGGMEAIWTAGGDTVPHILARNPDLSLTANPETSKRLIEKGVASAALSQVVSPEDPSGMLSNTTVIILDFDEVVAAGSEKIYKEQGLDGFRAHERKNADVPMAEGPFMKVVLAFAAMNEYAKAFPDTAGRPAFEFEMTIITARGADAMDRTLTTMVHNNVAVKRVIFNNGVPKNGMIVAAAAGRPAILLDDGQYHIDALAALVESEGLCLAGAVVPSGPRHEPDADVGHGFTGDAPRVRRTP